MTTRLSTRSHSTRLCLLLLLSALLCAGLPRAAARPWTSVELPNPQADPGGVCGRKVRSSVCDPDGYLSESDADEIQGVANFINEGTHGFKRLPCPGGTSGPQIAVAIVDSMRGGGGGDKKARAFQFARDLHDRWGVGDKACQNGVVLFFAVKDRAMGFSTGAGIKHVFTDAMIPVVMASVAPLLRDQQYGQAIVRAVTAIGNILSGGKPPEAEADGDGGGFGLFDSMFGLAVGAAVIGSTVSGSRSRRRYSRCKNVLRKIDSDRQKASDNQYVATSCPICLEDFDDDDSATRTTSRANATSGTSATRGTAATTATTTITAPLSVTATGSVRAASPDTVAASETQPLSTTVAAADVGGARRSLNRSTASTSSGSSSSSPTSASPTTAEEILGAADAGEKRVTITLACGHKFCKSCLATWVAGQNSNNMCCPICRQPITLVGNDDLDTAGATTRTEAVVEDRTNNGQPSGWDVYDPEYNFRMRRAQYFYSDFITWSMINSWDRDRYARDRPMAASTQFQAVDPVVVAQAARASGSGGSSFSFGGGSSAGGGGGGGGW